MTGQRYSSPTSLRCTQKVKITTSWRNLPKEWIKFSLFSVLLVKLTLYVFYLSFPVLIFFCLWIIISKAIICFWVWFIYFSSRSMAQSENPTSIAAVIISTQSGQSSQTEKTTMWIPTAVILVFIVIATILGNTLVLITTWQDRRLHKPNKYFIACLAVADLLVGILSVPIRLYLHFNHTDLIEVELCRFWSWIDILCEAASIITLTIISIDRYVKISHPFKYKSQMTTSLSIFVIFFIWLTSAVFATLGQFSYGGSKGINALVGKGCLNDNLVYLVILAAVFFFLPTLITVTMYALIFYTVYKRQKMSRNGQLGQSLYHDQRQRGKTLLQELKTVRMLSVVVGVFIVCWGPFFIYYLLLNYQKRYMLTSLSPREQQILGNVFMVILPSFNSLCNPIIYACFDRVYFNAIKQLFQRIFCLKKTCKQTSRKAEKFRKISSTQSFPLRKHKHRGNVVSLPLNEIQEWKSCSFSWRLNLWKPFFTWDFFATWLPSKVCDLNPLEHRGTNWSGS